MKIIIRFISCFFVAGTILLAGCKKDKEKKQECRIITCTDGKQTFHFTYNLDGTMSSMLEMPANDRTDYTYAGNIVTCITTNTGMFVRKRIITNNSDGYAVNVRWENDLSGSDWSNEAHQYNGTQITKTVRTTSSGTGGLIVDYVWNNGNLAQTIVNGNTNDYTYYLDKSYQTGEYRHLNQILTGEKKYNIKNLTKSAEAGSETYTISYEFDEQSRITSFSATSAAGTQTFKYQYECD
jgi:hypothetical protein